MVESVSQVRFDVPVGGDRFDCRRVVSTISGPPISVKGPGGGGQAPRLRVTLEGYLGRRTAFPISRRDRQKMGGAGGGRVYKRREQGPHLRRSRGPASFLETFGGLAI